MSEDGKFWAAIWVTGAVCLVCIVFAIFAYNVNRDSRVAAMVKVGADPMLAACSLGAPPVHTCNLYAASARTR